MKELTNLEEHASQNLRFMSLNIRQQQIVKSFDFVKWELQKAKLNKNTKLNRSSESLT